MRRLAILISCFLLLAAAASAARGAESKVPVTITADSMTYTQDKGTVKFEGSVVANHPKIEIRSKALTAELSESGGEMEAGQVQRIVATGDVVITSEGRRGECAEAVYEVQQRHVLMKGSPVLMDGDNRISGAQIEIWLDENRSVVTGSDTERVEATFFTDEEIR